MYIIPFVFISIAIIGLFMAIMSLPVVDKKSSPFIISSVPIVVSDGRYKYRIDLSSADDITDEELDLLTAAAFSEHFAKKTEREEQMRLIDGMTIALSWEKKSKIRDGVLVRVE